MSDLLTQAKGVLLRHNPYALSCTLSHGEQSQTIHAIVNQVGVTLTAGQQAILNDCAEAVLDVNEVTLGIPNAGWLLITPQQTYRLDTVATDQTAGVYYCRLSIVHNSNDTQNNNAQTITTIPLTRSLRPNGGR